MTTGSFFLSGLFHQQKCSSVPKLACQAEVRMSKPLIHSVEVLTPILLLILCCMLNFLQVFGNIFLDPEEALDRSNNFRTFLQGILLLFRQVLSVLNWAVVRVWLILRSLEHESRSDVYDKDCKILYIFSRQFFQLALQTCFFLFFDPQINLLCTFPVIRQL